MKEMRQRRFCAPRCVISFSRHLESLYLFYGEETGVRIARKHLGWYCEQLLQVPTLVRRELMAAADTAAQFAHAVKHFDDWANGAAAAA